MPRVEEGSCSARWTEPFLKKDGVGAILETKLGFFITLILLENGNTQILATQTIY